MELHKQIRELRELLGLPQAEVAIQIGVTPPLVGMYERGHAPLKPEVLDKLIGVLLCEIEKRRPRVEYLADRLGKRVAA